MSEQVPGFANKEDEMILVIPREVILKSDWNGLKAEGLEGFEKIIKENQVFKKRGDMELDPNWKQVIPYLIFQYKRKLFLMQRSDSGGEEKLFNKYSLGIGGHIREEDMDGSTVIDWAKREFEEEVSYEGLFQAKPLGLINSDWEGLLGQVHLGYAILLEGDSERISIKNEHLMGKLATLAEIGDIYDKMESWSQFVYDFLKKND